MRAAGDMGDERTRHRAPNCLVPVDYKVAALSRSDHETLTAQGCQSRHQRPLAGSIGEGLAHILESGLRSGRSKMQRYVTIEAIEDRPGLDLLMQPFGVWHRLDAKIRLQNAPQLLIGDEGLGLLPAEDQKKHYVALYAFS